MKRLDELTSGLGTCVVIVAVGGALLLQGCVTMETADERDMRARREQQVSSHVAIMRQQNSQQAAELAAMRADLMLLQENVRKLALIMEDYQGTTADQVKQIRDLRALVESLDTRVANVDSSWRDRMGQLRTALDAEGKQRKVAIEGVIKEVSKEIGKVAQTVHAAGTGGSEQTYTVQRGDTLSAIAGAFNVSIAALKQANGLKSDLIREGQVLKIPTR